MKRGSTLAKKKILVIEDEPDFSKAVQVLLEANGFEVLSAYSGKEGLAMAKQGSPDLIVLDVMLPEIDGYKICRLLKFDERYKKIPIIMLTARAQEQDRQLGVQTGADAYMVKSEKPDVLVEKIQSFLKHSAESSPPGSLDVPS